MYAGIITFTNGYKKIFLGQKCSYLKALICTMNNFFCLLKCSKLKSDLGQKKSPF